MKHVKGFENFEYDSTPGDNIFNEGGIIDENRFLHWERQYEELLNNREISNFIDRFDKYRDRKLSKVDFEIKPVFSKVRVRFVDKSNPSSAGGFYDPLISGNRDNYESGQISISYNDTTCIFNGKKEGNNINYSHSKSIKTKNNPPITPEGKEVDRTFEDLCKSFTFTLDKSEIPTMYYK